MTVASEFKEKPKEKRVSEYVRMSTEHQQYSTENQREIIRKYAEQRGMVIVRTYTDAGKSGLRIDGRDALKQLIHDVESGSADFAAILVYDVSRWGRFQDADESAYYEYICRRAKALCDQNVDTSACKIFLIAFPDVDDLRKSFYEAMNG